MGRLIERTDSMSVKAVTCAQGCSGARPDSFEKAISSASPFSSQCTVGMPFIAKRRAMKVVPHLLKPIWKNLRDRTGLKAGGG